MSARTPIAFKVVEHLRQSPPDTRLSYSDVATILGCSQTNVTNALRSAVAEHLLVIDSIGRKKFVRLRPGASFGRSTINYVRRRNDGGVSIRGGVLAGRLGPTVHFSEADVTRLLTELCEMGYRAAPRGSAWPVAGVSGE